MGLEADKNNIFGLSEYDISFNLEKFGQEEFKLLFITGLQNIGKTDMGKDIAESLNAIYVDLDLYLWTNINKIKDKELSNDDKLILEYLEKNLKGYYYLLPPSIHNWKEEDIINARLDIIKTIIKYREEIYTMKNMIIEGSQLLDNRYCNPDDFTDKCIIIKGNAFIKALIDPAIKDDSCINDILYKLYRVADAQYNTDKIQPTFRKNLDMKYIKIYI